MSTKKKRATNKMKLLERKYKPKWSKRFADQVKAQLMKLPENKK